MRESKSEKRERNKRGKHARKLEEANDDKKNNNMRPEQIYIKQWIGREIKRYITIGWEKG